MMPTPTGADSLLLRFACGLACLALFAGADWRQFRGNDNASVAADAKVPIAWNVTESENVAWKVALPGRGVAGAIVVGDQVIVTCSSGYKSDRLHILSFDAATGEPQWHRQFWATGRTLHHPTSAVAANTPASDGEAIYAMFSSNDLFCLDLQGNLRWLRGLTYDYPTAANDVGMASSPLVVGDTVVVQLQSQGESFAAGIDTATGETRWRKDLPSNAAWTSPTVLRGARPEEDLVLIQAPAQVAAHEPRSGREVWSYDANCSGIPSSVAVGDTIYVPADGITALQFDRAAGTVQRLWSENRLSPSSASPVVHDGKVYTVNRAGILACAEAAGGSLLWQLRLKGPFWATPVVAGGHLYCANQDGDVHVVALGEEGTIVETNEFEEPILGSPAVAHDAIFFRTGSHLWKIAHPSPPQP